MVGDLDIAIAGRLLNLEFRGDQVLIRCERLRSALSISSHAIPNLPLIGLLLTRSGMVVRGKVGIGPSFEIFPKPNWIARWISPTLQKLKEASG